MSNEEFQTLVLQELRGLKKGQEEIKNEQQEMKQEQQEMKQEQQEMKQEQQEMKQEQKSMKKELEEIRKDLKAVIEQTANLTEFKEEVNHKLDTMLNEINTLEVVVSKNWQDIAKLKAAR